MIRLLCLVSALGFALGSFAAEFLPPGRRPVPPAVHALKGGRVVTEPGKVLTNATIVIRDGLIVSVAAGAAVPPDARVWDLSGATIYAGFIEPCWMPGNSNAPVQSNDGEPIGRSGALTSGAAPFLGVVGEQTDRGAAGPGYDRAVVTPEQRAFLTYSPRASTLAGLRENGFTTAHVIPDSGIIRGTSTLVQLADDDPTTTVLRPDVFQVLSLDTRASKEDVYPRALMGVIAVVRQAFFDAEHYAAARADYERSPGGRKRPLQNAALEALQPVRERKLPVLIEPGSAVMNDRAMRLAGELGFDFAIVASGQEWRRPDIAQATGATFIVPLNLSALPKLPDADDWEQMDLDRLRAWDWTPENPVVLRKAGRDVALTTYGISDRKQFRGNLRSALDRGLSETDALAALTTVPAKLCGVSERLGTIAPGKIANLTIVNGSYFDPENKIREVWIDGVVYPVEPAKPLKLADADNGAQKKATPAEAKAKADEKKKEDAREAMKARAAQPPLEGRGPLTNPPAVLVRNATLWTCGPTGVLTNSDLLVRDGKIVSIGAKLKSPGRGTVVIDATGKHVTPGLIDAHSHTAILGGVNEGTLPSTAMVRIGDVINSETDTLYQQLAGGLTVANLLHGSANPIGGQNAVIKLRDGAPPEELKFAGAPEGIKFALGENVKQSNWGDKYKTRFPQSRMGVPAFIANRFEAARQYAAEWVQYREKGGPAPRRDLELEALAEILAGKRLIHCHSYRGDEILAFLRVCESYGIRIGTLQHVLEGYKVADEIARHGAGASCFSDWWAYKFEVIDAIAYAGSLMHARGVNVSFNSDSSELARRMNLEAAKAVRYGGTPETEALKFVTLNPAKQLGIADRVGSLEQGKDGDFVIWSRSPLDSRSTCEQTWIDGKQYFEIGEAAKRAARLGKEREDLIAKAKRVLAIGAPTKSGGEAARAEFFRRALEMSRDHDLLECGECRARKEEP